MNSVLKSTRSAFRVTLKLDELFCVACDKLFKNKRAKENHETSKKHQDKINKLVAEMEAEEEGQISGADSDADCVDDAESKSLKGEVKDEGRSVHSDGMKSKHSDEGESDVSITG